MKDHFKFYGVPAPARKELISRIWQSEKAIIKENIRPIVRQLWREKEREYQMIALELMGKCKKQFTSDDLPMIEDLITSKSWWDTVDFLASTIVGYILALENDQARSTAKRYMSSDNLWLNRTALIFQLKYKEETDAELLYQLIDKTMGSNEFFINKASGWALRQYSKFEPRSVEKYLTKNKETLAKLTIREGSKYL